MLPEREKQDGKQQVTENNRVRQIHRDNRDEEDLITWRDSDQMKRMDYVKRSGSY